MHWIEGDSAAHLSVTLTRLQRRSLLVRSGLPQGDGFAKSLCHTLCISRCNVSSKGVVLRRDTTCMISR